MSQVLGQCDCNDYAQYTANTGLATISVANPNLDGSGTVQTVLTGAGANGTLVKAVICNFKCWYCYESHIKDSKMDESTIHSILALAKNIIKNQIGLKTFIFSFFGGEPLLYFDKVVKPLLIGVKHLCDKNNVIFRSHITTNGLLINQDIINICSEYGLRAFQITLDGNKEKHDKIRYINNDKGSYESIINNIRLLAKNKLDVNIRVNCSKDTFENLHEILLDFNDLAPEFKRYLNFDFHKVWQDEYDLETELNDARNSFLDGGYKVTVDNMASILSSCYADKRYQATINYNGEVFKCTARDFKLNSGEGALNDGEIIWNEKYEKRLNSKFNNPPCMECRILPICAGGCSQHALEADGQEYCVLGFNEEAKTDVIINRFKSVIRNYKMTNS